MIWSWFYLAHATCIAVHVHGTCWRTCVRHCVAVNLWNGRHIHTTWKENRTFLLTIFNNKETFSGQLPGMPYACGCCWLEFPKRASMDSLLFLPSPVLPVAVCWLASLAAPLANASPPFCCTPASPNTPNNSWELLPLVAEFAGVAAGACDGCWKPLAAVTCVVATGAGVEFELPNQSPNGSSLWTAAAGAVGAGSSERINKHFKLNTLTNNFESNMQHSRAHLIRASLAQQLLASEFLVEPQPLFLKVLTLEPSWKKIILTVDSYYSS